MQVQSGHTLDLQEAAAYWSVYSARLVAAGWFTRRSGIRRGQSKAVAWRT